jgi:hypothetical protein
MRQPLSRESAADQLMFFNYSLAGHSTSPQLYVIMLLHC